MTMRMNTWRKWAVLASSGALLLQVPGCTESAAVLTAIFSGLSTGGLFWLIHKVLQ
jgi:hypothetical protein